MRKGEEMTYKQAIEQLEDDALFKGASEEINPLYAAYTVAIDAMEKQIPKKPKEYEDSCYLCPVCGNAVLYKGDKNDGIPYCLGCGQALDWREVMK